MGTGVQGYKVTRVQGYKGAGVRDYKVTGVQGYWVYESGVAQIQN
jgi:hypothetical protein